MKRLKYLTLAALVAFAACGEDEPPVVVVVTGTISGVVTIEGVGQSGVSVALSSGATASTDGSGAYSFTNVEAGAYTVTISGFPSDATFSSTSKAASIATAGQVVQVNFDGSFVRTSAILGGVFAGGVGLEGVSVSIGSASTTTDLNGQYSFSGLRAGSYTVTISGYDSNLYIFSSSSQTVALSVGQSQVVNFSGQLATTASIRGSLFLDENPKNDQFDSSEDKLAVAGVTITIVGPTVGSPPVTVETDANGDYAFTDLQAGTYAVSINDADADIPGTVDFGGIATVNQAVTVGSVGVVNFPFDITQQTIQIFAYLGRDGANAMEYPVEDVDVCLYGDRNLTNRLPPDAAGKQLNCDKTDEFGMVSFTYDRADDIGPTANTDNLVFATFGQNAADGAKAPPADHKFDPDANEWAAGVMEIAYSPQSLVADAPDVIDLLATRLDLSFLGVEIDDDALDAPWVGELFSGGPAAPVFRDEDVPSDPDIDGLFELGVANWNWPADWDPSKDAADLALTKFWARLRPFAAGNAGDGTHEWMQVPTADQGTVPAADDDKTPLDETRIIEFQWDGTNVPVGTVVALGTETVTYLDSDISVAVHHELDDLGDVPTYSKDDSEVAATNANVDIKLCPVSTDAKKTDDNCMDETAANFTQAGNDWTWMHLPVEYCFVKDTGDATKCDTGDERTSTFEVRAAPATGVPVVVLMPEKVQLTLDGSDQVHGEYPLDGGKTGGVSTFAIKSNNNVIHGRVVSTNLGDANPANWTGVKDAVVTVVATADNIQGSVPAPAATDPFTMTAKTLADGTFEIRTKNGVAALRDGPYMITVAAPDAKWAFEKTLTTDLDGDDATTPLSSGSEDNDDAMSGVRDLEGPGVGRAVNFEAVFVAGKITGEVVNDRDGDGNTIDPNEALAGAQVLLYAPDPAVANADITDPDERVMVTTATTNASGIYEFTGLHEGQYLAAWSAGTPDATVEVLQALGDSETDPVTILASAQTFGKTGATLPAWDYQNTVGTNLDVGDFSFLYLNTTIRGKVVQAADVTKGVGGMTVSLRRCKTTAALPASPAQAGTCATTLDVTANTTTAADGTFEFAGLTEGTYQITPAPTTVGGYTSTNPTSALYLTVGNGDVETAAANFEAS